MRKLKKSTDDIKKEIFLKFGSRYVLQSEYYGSHKRVIIYHNIKTCKHVKYTPIYKDFINGKSACPCCSLKYRNRKRKLTINDIRSRLSDPEYQIISKRYRNNSSKLTFFHNECKRVFRMSTNSFFDNKNRCPYCAGTYRKTLNELKLQLPGDYKILSKEYINDKTKLNFFHKKCQKSFLMRPNNFFIIGNRCPYCVASKGEKEISRILSAMRANF